MGEVFTFLYSSIQTCLDSGCHLEDLSRVIAKDEWQERVNFKHTLLIMAIIANLKWSVISSTSSSCRAASTDIHDPLSPLLPIVHRLWQVFWATSRILT